MKKNFKLLNNTNTDIKYLPEPTETQLNGFIPRLKDTLINLDSDDSSLADHLRLYSFAEFLN